MSVEAKIKDLRKTLKAERAAARAKASKEAQAKAVAEAGPKAKARAERAKGRMVATKSGKKRYKKW